MIEPENNIPLDDSNSADAEDQQSQQDIHSNGFDDEYQPVEDDGSADPDRLQQAEKASEAAYTLDLDKGIAPKAAKKEDTNIKE